MENEIIEVRQAEMLEAINRSDVDMQISTAKAYPRDIKRSLAKIKELAMYDEETAQDCFYEPRRRSAGGQDVSIEGLSVRMAEIVALAWGNLRVQTRIVGNDGQKITVQAVCHDLETNYAVCKEVQRRITDKNGRTFSQDMQVVTANAAAAIAYRNAVLTVIPKAVTKKIIEEVKDMAFGQSLDLEQTRQNMVAYFAKLGVTTDMILYYLKVDNIDAIDKDMIASLRGAANAIRDNDSTVQELFIKPMEDAKKEAEATKKASKAEKKAADALARAMGGNPTPEPQSAEKTPQYEATEGVTVEGITEQLDLLSESPSPNVNIEK